MKKLRISRILCLFLVLYLLIFLVRAPRIDAVRDTAYVLGAHRGNSVDYNENTLEAIKSAAADPKYNFIEFDVQYTKDKSIVLFHDYSMLRTQGKARKIISMTYEDIGSVSRYHIPTYDEVMDAVGGKKRLNIEIKAQGNPEDDKRLTDFIIKDCRERGILDRVLISSVSPDVVKYVSESYPDVKTGIIYFIQPVTYIQYKPAVKRFYEKIDEIGADYIMLHGINLKNYKLLTELKPQDRKMAIWYLNDEMYVLGITEKEFDW